MRPGPSTITRPHVIVIPEYHQVTMRPGPGRGHRNANAACDLRYYLTHHRVGHASTSRTRLDRIQKQRLCDVALVAARLGRRRPLRRASSLASSREAARARVGAVAPGLRGDGDGLRLGRYNPPQPPPALARLSRAARVPRARAQHSGGSTNAPRSPARQPRRALAATGCTPATRRVLAF
jgi:hypothetical protein